MSAKTVKKAEKTKVKNAKKYGDDSKANYEAKLTENHTLTEPLGVYDIRVNEGGSDIPFDTEKGIIVGNIRMGFGHYRILNGMQKDKINKPMPEESLRYVGHYIDHELVANIEKDCDARLARKKNGEPMRFLLTIGGAGAQRELFTAIIRHLLPAVKAKKAALYVNVGDYKAVWDELCRDIKGLKALSTEHMNNWEDTKSFAQAAVDGKVHGVHAFWHEDIFEAVYCTNLLSH